MTENNQYKAWFYSIPGVGDRTMEQFGQICPDVEELYRAGTKLWRKVLDARQLEQAEAFLRRYKPEEWYQMMQEKGIGFVCVEDAAYPRRLRNIPDPPYGLFYRGRLPEEGLPAVAVVGARDCSPYGSYVASGIGAALGEAGVQVISGMARGVDGISQEAALSAGGTSFGVLGCGVDVCYPKTNRELYDRLCESGGVLSFYAPGTEAKPQHFPPRNRIVSGLADVLLVVEAREKSGTLITVDMALEQGKEVYAVPGRVTDRLSDGCNRLLKQGAGVFLSPEVLVREIGAGNMIRLPAAEKAEESGDENKKKTESEQVVKAFTGMKRSESKEADGKENKRIESGKIESREKEADRKEKQGAGLKEEILQMLTFEPVSVETIMKKYEGKYAISEVTTVLMKLCLEGSATQVGTGWFCKNYH